MQTWCGLIWSNSRQIRWKSKVKSSTSHKPHRAVLISVSSALSQTPIYTVRPRIRGQCILRCACLHSSFWWYSLHLPMEGWPGWVDLGGWLRTGMVTHPSTNRARRWLTLTSLMQSTTLPTKPNRHKMGSKTKNHDYQLVIHSFAIITNIKSLI